MRGSGPLPYEMRITRAAIAAWKATISSQVRVRWAQCVQRIQVVHAQDGVARAIGTIVKASPNIRYAIIIPYLTTAFSIEFLGPLKLSIERKWTKNS